MDAVGLNGLKCYVDVAGKTDEQTNLAPISHLAKVGDKNYSLVYDHQMGCFFGILGRQTLVHQWQITVLVNSTESETGVSPTVMFQHKSNINAKINILKHIWIIM